MGSCFQGHSPDKHVSYLDLLMSNQWLSFIFVWFHMEYQHACGMFILVDDNFIHCHAMFLPPDIIKWGNLNPNINSLIVPTIIFWQIFLTCTKHAVVSKVNLQFLSLWLALLTKISKLYNLVWYWSPLKIYDLCYARFKSYLIFLFPHTFDFCNVWLIEVFHIC